MLISVIIPTRDRAILFFKALRSILNQKDTDYFIHVVVDGSNPKQLYFYNKINKLELANVNFIFLLHRDNGHGPNFVRNVALEYCKTEYVAFLDDDDQWTDPYHLYNIAQHVQRHKDSDYIITQQIAVKDKIPLNNQDIWLEKLSKKIDKTSNETFYKVSSIDILDTFKFPHLNTSVIRRDLIIRIGGFDDTIIYEGDRDFVLRILSLDPNIYISSRTTAVHNIPLNNSVTTKISTDLKKLYQIQNSIKNIFDSNSLSSDKKLLQYLYNVQKVETQKSGMLFKIIAFYIFIINYLK